MSGSPPIEGAPTKEQKAMTQRNPASTNRPADDQQERFPESLVEEATTWFVRMTTGDASTEDRQLFQRWLEQSPTHWAAYSEAKKLWDDLGQIPAPAAVSPTPSRRFTGWKPGLAACFALLACVLFGQSATLENLQSTYFTSVGEIRQITLSDRSVLFLNTDSAVNIEFTEHCRCITLLRGEAYFEVSKNPARPFEVHTGIGRTRAVGTAFSVRKTQQDTRVAVTEGRVEIASELNNAEIQSLLLNAGDTAFYDRNGVQPSGSHVADNTAAWRHGKLIFINRPLSEVVSELDRYHAGKIVLARQPGGEQHFTGVLNLQDTGQALMALEQTQSLSILEITPLLIFLRASH
ncbi:MAG: FecR family protein [Ketobacter sp.]